MPGANGAFGPVDSSAFGFAEPNSEDGAAGAAGTVALTVSAFGSGGVAGGADESLTVSFTHSSSCLNAATPRSRSGGKAAPPCAVVAFWSSKLAAGLAWSTNVNVTFKLC